MEPRTFCTPGGLDLEIRIPAGTIEVRAEETAQASLQIRGERDPDDFRISFDELGSRARLTVEYRGPDKLFGWRGADLRVDVIAPFDTGVDAETGSADLEVAGRVGSLSFRSGSGDCRFGTVDGDAVVKSASGDVAGDAVGGSLTLQTASGDARVGLVGDQVVARSTSGDVSIGSAEAAHVTTVSGDVDLAALRTGSTTIRSVSGDVEVGVAPGSNVYLDLMSTSGSTSSDLDMSGDPEDGEADVEVHAVTVSGDVRVVRAPARG